MYAPDNTLGQNTSPFPHTRWSLVARAIEADETDRREAWSTLCNDYWFPLYAYARRAGNGPEDAEDLTQAFFANFIRRDSLNQATPERGRLRSYLLGAFKNFMITEHRKATAEKRGGVAKTLSLELMAAEDQFMNESTGAATPEQEFDRRWALQLIQDTLDKLETEYARRGKLDHFEAFRPYVSCTETQPTYETLSKRLGLKQGALRIAIYRLRQRFAQLMREAIAETVLTDGDVEAERLHLMTVFSQ